MAAASSMFSKKDKTKTDDDASETPPEAEGEEGEAPAKKKMAGKTLILFVVLPALLVVGGGGAAAMMMLGGGKGEESASAHPGEEEHAAADDHGEIPAKDDHGKPAKGDDDHGSGEYGGGAPVGTIEVGHIIPGAAGDPSYYDMPKMIVNLADGEGGRPLLLELELVLESSHASTFDQVPSLMPRLMDQIQTFLRELRVEDLNGSAGTYRLRLELLKRFNIVMAPQKLDSVLIEGILIQ